ncbi:MAG: serine/threonine-protein kinase [Polyangiales bacterium]
MRPQVLSVIEPGEVVADRYRALRLLGEGAMGAVYEAEHVFIGRRVALKVLHPRFARSHEAVARFTREARAAAALGHPHIVAVTDFGSHEGRPFLVMELLRGESLADRLLRAGALAPAEACRVAGEVLSALASAHAVGVVHRDLKPENVFLCEDRGGAAKLLDFGVSKFHPPGARAAHVTKDGTPIGTPSYMAPEQWTGQRDVDLRADVYAAGVMLYELLTGALPFEGATEGVLYGTVVHGTEPPAAPSELLPALPRSLDAVVLKAVSRDRAARHQSAEEFLDALRPFGASAEVLPVDAAALASLKALVDESGRSARVAATTELDPAPAADPAPAGPQRRPARWAAAALGALLVSAGALAVSRQRRAPTPVATAPPVAPTAPTPAPAEAPPAPPEPLHPAAAVAPPEPAAPPPAVAARAPRAAPTRRPSRGHAAPRGTAMTREF